MSSVLIYFDSHMMAALKREEQYTVTDFLAGMFDITQYDMAAANFHNSFSFLFLAVCGGLCGLCLGISALSIIEFLYFSTLRLYWSLSQCKSNDNVDIGK